MKEAGPIDEPIGLETAADAGPQEYPVADAPAGFDGIGVAPGIAIGPAYVYARALFSVQKRKLSPDELEAEVERFEWAVSKSEHNLRKIFALTREKLGPQSAEIFEAQRLMLRDETLYDAVVKMIREDRFNADFAVMEVMSHHRQRLEASDSQYLRERSHDLQDVQDRIVMHLRRGKHLSSIEKETIVIAENLTAADLVLFSRRGILGCAMDHGGPTSHVSIIARALGVPAIVCLRGLTEAVRTGDVVILDALDGKVYVNPEDDLLAEYRRRQQRYERHISRRRRLAHLPAETKDGHRIHLRANIEFMEELEHLDENGAEGIGLTRTEMLLLLENDIAVEEEDQFAMYRQIVESAAGEPVTFRLLDLGGDKMLPVAHREHNPLLGWRGIRVLLDKPDLLVPQIRAMLRASAYGSARILAPMITTMEEVHLLRDLIDTCSHELHREGHRLAEEVPVGVMVEVPAVALLADRFAAEVDFLSLGTNDLTQYTLAVDRGNDLVAPLYREISPAVLRLIAETAAAARRHRIPLSLCGELGGQPHAAPLLVGLGIDEISASPTYIPEVKQVIRSISKVDAEALAHAALQAPDASVVTGLLHEWLSEYAPTARPGV